MESWLQQYWIELAGTIFAIIYLSLSIRENIWLWPVGFLTSFFYLIVFFQSRLYADMGLQFYYLVVSVYGWFHWMGQRKNGVLVKTDLPTVSIVKMQWIVYLLAIGILIIFIYIALIFLPGMLDLPPSDLPLGDAFTTAASIVATWMLARKFLENWLIWIVVNAFSLGMYAYKGLYITVFLFVIYTAMSVVGYYRWKRHMLHNATVNV
ncbi:nicotinamide riboside transporter PnuC [Alkaliflexus imshenetskii]|uniref:nicotinamide riboside transporter PnuC n=1 Tax=Alkaliflexus imshenetskii TaxID=286730 RepID=UPI0005C57D06|nr:nicotinamide riboside transporter PnuC [Alkaliflexus imshenetskii]